MTINMVTRQQMETPKVIYNTVLFPPEEEDPEVREDMALDMEVMRSGEGVEVAVGAVVMVFVVVEEGLLQLQF